VPRCALFVLRRALLVDWRSAMLVKGKGALQLGRSALSIGWIKALLVEKIVLHILWRIGYLIERKSSLLVDSVRGLQVERSYLLREDKFIACQEKDCFQLEKKSALLIDRRIDLFVERKCAL